jgi:plastocyanin
MKHFILTTAVIVLAVTNAFAATHDVSIENFEFVPNIVHVGVGDTVRWTNNDSVFHTSTSDTFVWDSGTIIIGGTFEFTFNTIDFYPYHCNFHSSMTGAVNVEITGVESASLGELKAVFASE